MYYMYASVVVVVVVVVVAVVVVVVVPSCELVSEPSLNSWRVFAGALSCWKKI